MLRACGNDSSVWCTTENLDLRFSFPGNRTPLPAAVRHRGRLRRRSGQLYVSFICIYIYSIFLKPQFALISIYFPFKCWFFRVSKNPNTARKGWIFMPAFFRLMLPSQNIGNTTFSKAHSKLNMVLSIWKLNPYRIVLLIRAYSATFNISDKPSYFNTF